MLIVRQVLESFAFLLESCGPEIVNVRDRDGYLPLHLLALGLRRISFRRTRAKE